MKRMLAAAALAAGVALGGCGGGTVAARGTIGGPGTPGKLETASPPTAGASGVEVQAMATFVDASAGPLRFIRRPLPGAELRIRRAHSAAILASAWTDTAGRVRAALEPGTYAVEPQPATSGAERFLAEEVEVAVTAGAYAAVLVEYRSDRW